jgi:hypothetical protein
MAAQELFLLLTLKAVKEEILALEVLHLLGAGAAVT